MEDQGDIAHPLCSDMMQQMIAGNRMGHDAESQEDAEENEGEETVDVDVSISAITREKMLHHLMIFEGFVAGTNDHGNLAYLLKVRK